MPIHNDEFVYSPPPTDIDNAPVEAAPFNDRTLIRPLELDDSRGRWIFEPRADITALESVLISHMFSAIAIRHLHGNHSRWDWREYLTRSHYAFNVDLARHFRPME